MTTGVMANAGGVMDDETLMSKHGLSPDIMFSLRKAFSMFDKVPKNLF